jgi:5-methylcytosine-specific restriction endonuclease McrA
MGLFSKKDGRCIDCGTAITIKSIRCKDCHYKYKIAENKAEHKKWQQKYIAKQRKKDPRYKLPSSPANHTSVFKSMKPGNLRDRIRNRDGYRCQRCGAIGSKTVHHIDYNKANDRELNLITLCAGCNTDVNYKRGYWTRYFQILMKATHNRPNTHWSKKIELDL